MVFFSLFSFGQSVSQSVSLHGALYKGFGVECAVFRFLLLLTGSPFFSNGAGKAYIPRIGQADGHLMGRVVWSRKQTSGDNDDMTRFIVRWLNVEGARFLLGFAYRLAVC